MATNKSQLHRPDTSASLKSVLGTEAATPREPNRGTNVGNPASHVNSRKCPGVMVSEYGFRVNYTYRRVARRDATNFGKAGMYIYALIRF